MMNRHERNIALLLLNQTGRRLTREERKRRREHIIAALVGMALGALVAWLCIVPAGADVEPPAPVSEPTEAVAEAPAAAPASPESEASPTAVPLGDFTVTHYCVCEVCCGKAPSHPAYGVTASGRTAVPGVTVAVDPETIPLGSTVLVGYGDGETHTYRADDTGSTVRGAHLDLCVGDHATALALGVRTATVSLLQAEAAP